MIVVTGTESTSEFVTAIAVRDALAALWPGSPESPEDEELIRISAGAKISGYKVADIDILIAAKLRPGRAFIPRRVLRDRNGLRIEAAVKTQSFVAVLEVKDHDPSRVRITGDSIEVHYTGDGASKWSSAVQQNVDQVHAIKAYLDHQHADVFVYRAVIMRGFDKRPCAGALGATFDGHAFLTALAETVPLLGQGAQAIMRSGPPQIIDKVLAAPVFRTLKPTSLDRKRMDRLAVRDPMVDELLASLGSKMLRLRGRGGTGKTVMLLQVAWRAYDERAARSVVLTYNHALASDIRRLMALMNVPSDPAEGGIAVRTVMQFVTSWLARLGLLDREEEWVEGGYEAKCAAALEMISQGALTPADIESVKVADPAGFAFDYVIADEAQDWPDPELELIKALYAPERICLADGVDQLLRGGASNWERGVLSEQRAIVPLKRCLRMKANLAVFANTLAERADVNWKVEPNTDAPGGRVVIVTGPLVAQRTLIDEMIGAARSAGNEAIDLLFCVPSSGVVRIDGRASSRLASALKSWSYEVWDGADDVQRRDFPRSQHSLRIVQYASCRGLEGWTVLLDGLDAQWNAARADAARNPRLGSGFGDADQEAAAAAWRNCLIPLSRAIDTLVIGLEDPESPAGKVLLNTARALPDIVEVAGLQSA